MKKRYGILTVILYICLLSCNENEKVETVKTGMEDKPLPVFTLLKPDSTMFSSANFPKDKKLALFVYSPTCQYCRTQMRETINNISSLKNDQICVIINGDYQSLKGFSSYFKLEDHASIIIGIDTGNVIRNSFHVNYVPFTAVFNKDQRLRTAYVGRIGSKTLVNIISN